MKKANETVVLCGASAYEEKYYLNPQFSKLPEHIRQELQIMCVLYTQKVGGILMLEFTPEGHLEFKKTTSSMTRSEAYWRSKNFRMRNEN